MILGFHYHIPATIKDNKILLPGYLGVFIDSLSLHFNKIYLFMHSPKNNQYSLLDYKLKSANIELVNIGIHEHMFKRSLFSGKFVSKVKSYLSTIDIMLIRGPSPLLPSFTKMCKKHTIPFSFLLVGDYLEVLESSPNMNNLKRLILSTYYKNNKRYQDKYITDEAIFVNSAKLYEEYNKKVKNCIQVKTTTLSENDFFYRDDTCKDNYINLLYTGRIDPTKGIEEIFHSVSILKNKGITNIRINLVGWETKKGFLNTLEKLSQKLGISDNYIFHGKKTVGIDLFKMYRNSDIYILASRGDFEGFPRTLWEAMANSLPIIATKVGSIPHFLNNETSVLTEPNDVQMLSNNIEILIKDSTQRKKLITNAIKLARTNTLEIQALNLRNEIERYLK